MKRVRVDRIGNKAANARTPGAAKAYLGCGEQPGHFCDDLAPTPDVKCCECRGLPFQNRCETCRSRYSN